MKKILICISGGGAIQLESAAGALTAIEASGALEGAEVSYRACSGGAPVAALHAAGIKASAIVTLIRITPMRNLIRWPFLSRYMDASGVKSFLEERMPTRPLPNCRLAITREKDMRGCLVDATPITAVTSMSIPGVFRPQKIGGDEYVDGGVVNIIPTPAIPDIPSYDRIFLLLSPESLVEEKKKRIFGEFETVLRSAVSLMDREVTQIYEDGWDRISNVTVIRPDVPRAAANQTLFEELLGWSPGHCMMNHAYEYTRALLAGGAAK